MNQSYFNQLFPLQQTLPVICSFDSEGNIKPMYIRIGKDAFKVASSYVKESYAHAIVFQCEVFDNGKSKPLRLEYRNREHVWLIPKN